ncbi:MAG: DUF2290 domain-containing protein [Actinomycetota bacterium]
MRTNSRVVREEIDLLLAYLNEAALAVYVNYLTRSDEVVSWHVRDRSVEFLPDRDRMTSETYRHWLESGAYSAVLFDGAMLQLSYRFVSNQIVAHRLAWIPSPFEFEPGFLESQPLIDVFDLYAAGPARDVVIRAPIRFDFDVEAARPGHPASHLSINSGHCRIACAAPVGVGQFVRFVFSNFYPDVWRAHPYLASMPTRAIADHTITDDERAALHVYWSR